MLTIQAPPSKSVSHRTLMGAALASGTSHVSNVLMSKDIERTVAILASAGARIHPAGTDGFTVTGMNGAPHGALPGEPPLSCDVHESGTTCRLLTAILAAGRGRFRIHGAPRMHERPIGQLVDTLRTLGVHVAYEGAAYCPPLLLDTQGWQGQTACIGMDESSQYLSGLLLAAPLRASAADGTPLTIAVGGDTVVSWPYVGLTLQCLEDFGLEFRVETLPQNAEPHHDAWQAADWRSLQQVLPGRVRFVVPPGRYRAGDYTIEGDWSGASYFLAAGAVGRRPVKVTGLRADSLQGDRALLQILRRMDARVHEDVHGVTVSPSALRGATLDMGHCPDLVPTVAALAAFAKGRTTISNVAHLRIKESDRIAAPAAELRKVGIVVEEHADGLTIMGAGDGNDPLHARDGRGPLSAPESTVFLTHGDHRMAMSMSLLGLSGPTPHAVHVDNPQVVSKSFPNFWQMWSKVLA